MSGEARKPAVMPTDNTVEVTVAQTLREIPQEYWAAMEGALATALGNRMLPTAEEISAANAAGLKSETYARMNKKYVEVAELFAQAIQEDYDPNGVGEEDLRTGCLRGHFWEMILEMNPDEIREEMRLIHQEATKG